MQSEASGQPVAVNLRLLAYEQRARESVASEIVRLIEHGAEYATDDKVQRVLTKLAGIVRTHYAESDATLYPKFPGVAS